MSRISDRVEIVAAARAAHGVAIEQDGARYCGLCDEPWPCTQLVQAEILDVLHDLLFALGGSRGEVKL